MPYSPPMPYRITIPHQTLKRGEMGVRDEKVDIRLVSYNDMCQQKSAPRGPLMHADQMSDRDYIVLILAVALGIASGAAIEILRPFSTCSLLVHALGSKTSGTLIRIAGFGLSLSKLSRHFGAKF